MDNSEKLQDLMLLFFNLYSFNFRVVTSVKHIGCFPAVHIMDKTFKNNKLTDFSSFWLHPSY